MDRPRARAVRPDDSHLPPSGRRDAPPPRWSADKVRAMAQASVVTSLILGVPVISIFVNRHLDTKIEEARRHDEVTEQLLENRERLRRLDEKVTQLHENRERLQRLDEKVEHLHGKLDEIDHLLRREGDR